MKRFISIFVLICMFLLNHSSVTAQTSDHITLETEDWTYLKLKTWKNSETSSFKLKKPFGTVDRFSLDMETLGVEIGLSTTFVDFISVFYFNGENPDFDPTYFDRQLFDENAFVESLQSYGITFEQAVFPLLIDGSGWKFFINSSGMVGATNYSGILRRDIASRAEVENFEQWNASFGASLSAVGDFAFGPTKIRLSYAPLLIRFGYGRYSFSPATFGVSMLLKIRKLNGFHSKLLGSIIQ